METALCSAAEGPLHILRGFGRDADSGDFIDRSLAGTLQFEAVFNSLAEQARMAAHPNSPSYYKSPESSTGCCVSPQRRRNDYMCGGRIDQVAKM